MESIVFMIFILVNERDNLGTVLQTKFQRRKYSKDHFCKSCTDFRKDRPMDLGISIFKYFSNERRQSM